ncbi:relaxase/mobilization nuclease domain-containing protein [Ralstonia mannitolilytica]|uniref:relaxase/mobilization nuclease domain-containing protein n=1 Tax=Ralstonia mannitolilytica TaxID=105219 RepID=UPI001C9897D2|nr:relaxase/mobilization nuclease domain-containing protein [Ralstonia mannitolilytica]MBY4720425.1 relaxase/mobilization nuclease domain-containing protein [Ralstonia mannitolilytica]
MIIKLIDNSRKNGKNGTATGAVNYVLSSKDWKGEKRECEPMVLEGNPQLTKDIDMLVKNNEQKCISGVIAFAKNEKLTDEQKRELIKDFEKTFLGNMRGRVNCLYVEHKEEDGEHIHFIINKIDLKTNRSYNPFSPGKITKELRECFTAIQNNKYGFNQVIADPMKTILSNGEKKAKLYSDYKNKFASLYDKVNIDKACKDLVRKGVVKDKEGLVKFLQEDMGYKLYNNRNNIVILKDNAKIVLKGGIYQSGSLSYKEIKDGFDKWKQEQGNKIDIDSRLEKLNKLVNLRDEYNSDRYKARPSKPVVFKNLPKQGKAQNELGTAQSSRTTLPPTQAGKTAQTASYEDKPNHAQPTSNSNNKAGGGSTGSSGGSGGGSSNGGGASGSNVSRSAIETAKGKLANATTWEERMRAQYELSKAERDYEFACASAIAEENKRLLAEQEQKRIEELNKEIKL